LIREVLDNWKAITLYSLPPHSWWSTCEPFSFCRVYSLLTMSHLVSMNRLVFPRAQPGRWFILGVHPHINHLEIARGETYPPSSGKSA
jgi:hypothetical protein